MSSRKWSGLPLATPNWLYIKREFLYSKTLVLPKKSKRTHSTDPTAFVAYDYWGSSDFLVQKTSPSVHRDLWNPACATCVIATSFLYTPMGSQSAPGSQT